MTTPVQRIYNPVIERMTRDELLALQWNKLQRTLERAFRHNAFYRERFQKAGLNAGSVRSLEDYQRRVPTLSKADFLDDQNEHPPYGRRLMIPPSAISSTFLTSGTSGKGQEVHACSYNDLVDSGSAWANCLHWAGVMPGDTAYHMMPVGVTAGPVTLLNAFQSYGLQTFAVGNMEGAQRLEMMQRFKPNFISTGPVYLRRLTTLCQGAGIDPRRDFPGLKSIKIGTYGYDVDWAREMEAFWGCRLSDSYASTQAGAGIASTCERGVHWPDGTRGVMHVPEHRILLEVVNPETGENARDGEEGEAIITPLDKEAMPVVRFRTGDRVVLRDHRYCPCGRPFIGIEAGTVSRYDAMLKIRGMNLWPEAVDKVVFGHAEVEEYNGRVLVDGRGREVAQVLVEFKAGAAGEPERRVILGRIESGVKESTGVSVEALEAAPGTIEKFVYKEKRWKDTRKQGM